MLRHTFSWLCSTCGWSRWIGQRAGSPELIIERSLNSAPVVFWRLHMGRYEDDLAPTVFTLFSSAMETPVLKAAANLQCAAGDIQSGDGRVAAYRPRSIAQVIHGQSLRSLVFMVEAPVCFADAR